VTGVTEWIVGGGLLGIFVMMFKNNADTNKKIGRIYGRFDDYKEHFEDRYTSKDVCKAHHEHLETDIKEIKDNVKELLRRNGG